MVENGKTDSNRGVERDSAGLSVVALGASAGGLEALFQFFEQVPADSGIAFVVVTHQMPDHVSLLPELVAKHTQLKVTEAKDGDHLQANHVFISPSGGQLTIFHGVLQFLDTSTGSSPLLPIDTFFRSLAQDQQNRAIGIILSGTGADGTLGVRAIKGESGMVMVQNPKTARYDGMPQSAINTGMADYVLDAVELPVRLMAYIGGNWPADSQRDDLSRVLPKIFNQLRARTGHDFSSYKLSTIRRRVQRRMNVQQIGSPLVYVGFLQDNSQEIDQLFKELLITVTSFFRDPEVFDALAGEIRKALESSAEDDVFRIWVPGCATGEEAYSIAILVQECLAELKKKRTVQVFATDLDSDAIETARTGRYAEGIASDIDARILQQYFTKEDNNYYRIDKIIREMIVFAPHNMIKDPPFTKLDLLTCRNDLIYLNRDLQSCLLPIFHYALAADGLLLLGTSETIGLAQGLFTIENKRWKIYRRKETANTVHPVFPLSVGNDEVFGQSVLVRPGRAASHSGVELIKEFLISAFVPTSVIVDGNGEIIHVHGKTGLYLELPAGQPSNNLIDMARDGLQLDLAAAFRHARVSDNPISHNNIMVKSNDGFIEVDISVRRVPEPLPIRGLMLVTFLPSPAKIELDSGADAELQQQGRFEKLELELRYMKETLQKAIRQSDTANEDLKSTNEELQSTNEELQSANEELETSKEEMQSLNEELQTVNAELSIKLDELSHSNDDMQNLLNSTEIATLFLNNEIRIKRFAKSATRVFKVRDVDIGRPLGEIVHDLDYKDLLSDVGRVLETLVFIEKEIRTRDGSDSYRVRILPYRTSGNMIDGVVITLVDIKEIQEARDYAQSIIATITEPFLVINEELRVISSNSAFYQYFQLTEGAVVGQLIGELGVAAQWDITRLRQLLNSLVAEQPSFDGFEIAGGFSHSDSKTLFLKGRQLTQRPDQPGLVLLTFNETFEAE